MARINQRKGPAPVLTGPLRPWIDTHAHITGINNSCETKPCLDASIAAMDKAGTRKSIVILPPAASRAYSDTREASHRKAVALRPDRLSLGVGGATLNPLITRQPEDGHVSGDLLKQFNETADKIVAGGGAVVFGETAALHLSYEPRHGYDETPANTPLFLQLADIAARRDIPIDIHIDVVKEPVTTPSFFTRSSPNNPPRLNANIPQFEEMLAHNRNARIVLAHAGRDTTGQMSAALLKPLLAAHRNLYLQLHPINGPLGSPTAIVTRTGDIAPEWIDLLRAYPDRAVIGSDIFFTGEEDDVRLLQVMQRFVQRLPEDLALKIGCTNAVAIYRLPSGCE